MPGRSSRCEMISAARLVLVKGLSSSTNHPSHAGHGIAWRRDSSPQTRKTASPSPAKPSNAYKIRVIALSPGAQLATHHRARDGDIQTDALASVGEPFAVAAADELAKAAGVVGEIAVAGFERAGVLHALKTAAEAEGLIGPIAGGGARLAQPLLQPFSQRRGVGAFRRRRAGVASERGQGAQPPAPRRERV